MPLKTFCRSVYARNGKIKRQSTFISKVFRAAGSRYKCTDSYWSQLFDRETPVGTEITASFPETIRKKAVYTLLRNHLTPPVNTKQTLDNRCSEVVAKLGLPFLEEIQPEPFVWALTDWFDAIVHATETADTLKQAYLQRVEGIDPDKNSEDERALYPGDAAEVLRAPNDRERKIPFWGAFTYEWTIKNTGAVTWSKRTLVCVNPKGTHIRPANSQIEIPQTPPNGKAIFLPMEFTARGQEGEGTSCWEMHDEDGNNCFPQHPDLFNINICTINPNLDNPPGVEE